MRAQNTMVAAGTKPDQDKVARQQAQISVQRYFEVSLLLMLTTAFATVATTGKLDLVATVSVAGALLLRLFSRLREVDYSLAPRTVTRLAVLYILFYPLDFLIFSSGPSALDHMLTATVHLVLFATVVKVFSTRTYRDYGYLATLSFLMMLAGAVLTVRALYLVFFAPYVVFAISTFISYEIKRSSEASLRPPQGPFRLPAQNRSALEKALLATTTGLAFGIVALAAVLFFIIPRYRTGYLTGLGMDAQNITGFSESVNLGDIRKIKLSSAVVMRVIAEGDRRQFQEVKWRGVGLSSFDGQHWYNDNTEQVPISPASFQRFVLPPPDGWERRPRHPLRYRVLLSGLSTDVLFAATVPREVVGRFRLIATDQSESLHNPQHSYAPLSYEAVSDTGLPSPAQLRLAGQDYPDGVRLLHLRLPTVDPRVRELARHITESAQNNYDRAAAIEQYLRGNYAYSLDPPGIDPSDPISSFLFEAREGYCEYFAAAMAVMLRTLGIPSRLVNGFQTGTYNRVGKDFVVRARDAHSWVEAYFPDYGWIPFDPTPADPSPVIPSLWEDYGDALALFWNEWVINYDFAHQVKLARQMEQESRQLQQAFHRRWRQLQRHGVRAAYGAEAWLINHKLPVLLFALAVLAAVLAAETGCSLREIRFRWAWTFGRHGVALSPHDATLAYLEFLRALRKKGYRKVPGETPWEFALSITAPSWAGKARAFTRLYTALRFGQAAVPLTQLKGIVEEIRKS